MTLVARGVSSLSYVGAMLRNSTNTTESYACRVVLLTAVFQAKNKKQKVENDGRRGEPKGIYPESLRYEHSQLIKRAAVGVARTAIYTAVNLASHLACEQYALGGAVKRMLNRHLPVAFEKWQQATAAQMKHEQVASQRALICIPPGVPPFPSVRLGAVPLHAALCTWPWPPRAWGHCG